MTEPAPIFAMDEPVRPMSRPAPEAVPVRRRADPVNRASKNLAEAAASLRRSHEAHLLASFGIPQASQEVLDFGLPSVGDEELVEETFQFEDQPSTADGAEPFEVRVGTLGWTGSSAARRKSGRACSLLLRGPQVLFLEHGAGGCAAAGTAALRAVCDRRRRRPR